MSRWQESGGKRSQSEQKPKYSGISSVEVSIGGRARLRRKRDTLEGRAELPSTLPEDAPGNRCAGPHGIEREEMRHIYVPVLLKTKQKKLWMSKTKQKEEKHSQRKILPPNSLG